MTKKITIEEALKLVEFEYIDGLGWCVNQVNGDLLGSVRGFVYGNVKGNVLGTINGKKWKYIEES